MSDSSDTPDALRATEKKCEPVRCRPPRRSPSPPPPSSGGFFSSVAATVTSTVSSLVGRRQKRPGRKRCKRAAPRDSPPPSPPPVAPPPVPVPAPDARPPRLPVSCAAPPQPPTPLSELTLGDLSPSSLLAEMPVQCARPPPRTPPHPALLAPLPPPVHVGCRTIAPPPLVPRPILLCVPPVFVPPATLSEPPAAVDASAAKTLYWDQIKVPTPACLGLPSSAVAPLSSLCIAALLDAGVHIRSHPDATPELAAQIEDAMVQFPLLGLADPRPVDEWPEHIFAALSAPDAPRPAINLSVELHASAWRIYDLVTTSRAVDALATPAAVSRAMSRYEVFLGLVHDNPGALLVPALDILTVWYSHLIRTDEYKTYCVARWGAGSASLVDRTGPMIVLLSISSPQRIRHAALVDVDGGSPLALDLLIMASTDTVYMYANTGSGLSATSTPTNLAPLEGDAFLSIAVGDFGGGSLFDLVTLSHTTTFNHPAPTTYASYVSLCTATIPGVFDGAVYPVATLTAGPNPRFVDAVDVSGDGIDDVVLVYRYPQGIYAMVSKGARTFAPPVVIMATGLVETVDIMFLDLNADSLLDMCVFGVQQGTGASYQALLSFVPGIGSGAFGDAAVLVATPVVNGQSVGLAAVAANVPSSARDDLALYYRTTASDDNVRLFPFTDGQPVGISFAASASLFATSSAETVVAIDVNGDGHLDVVTHSELGITTHVSNGIGGFSHLQTVEIPVGSPYGSSFHNSPSAAVADLDRDGRFDVVVGTFFFREFYVIWGVGEAGKLDEDNLQLIFAADAGDEYSVAVADVGASDGGLDIVLGLGGPLSVGYIRGYGNRTFGPIVYVDAPNFGTPDDVTVVDVNGDGYVNLVTAGSSSLPMVVVGTADGFAGGAAIELGWSLSSESTCSTDDVNQDGEVDVMCTGSKTTVGFGPITALGAAASTALLNGWTSVAVAVDLDQSGGPLDVVRSSLGYPITVGLASSTVMWPTYTDVVIDATFGAVSLAVGDINGDGNQDIIASTMSGDGVRYFVQQWLPLVAPHSITLTYTVGAAKKAGYSIRALMSFVSASASLCRSSLVLVAPGTYTGCAAGQPLAVRGHAHLRPSTPTGRIVFDCTATATPGGSLFYVSGGAQLALERVDIVGATSTPALATSSSPITVTGAGSSLTLTNATVTQCSAAPNTGTYFQALEGRGGAIAAIESATLTLNSVVLSGNTAAQSGGAIYAAFSATVVATDVEVTGNAAGGGVGGGIAVDVATSLKCTACRMSGNTASEAGGGLYVGGEASTAVLVATTVEANSAGVGGGIGVYGGQVEVGASSAVVANTAAWGGGVAVTPQLLAPAPFVAVSALALGAVAGLASPTLVVDTGVVIGSNSASYGGGAFACHAVLDIAADVAASGAVLSNVATSAGAAFFVCRDPEVAAAVAALEPSGAVVAASSSPPAALVAGTVGGVPGTVASGVGLGGSLKVVDVFGGVVTTSVVGVTAGVATAGVSVLEARQSNSAAGVSLAAVAFVAEAAVLPLANVAVTFAVADTPAGGSVELSVALSLTLCPPGFGSVAGGSGGSGEGLVCAACPVGSLAPELSAAPCASVACAEFQVLTINATCLCRDRYWLPPGRAVAAGCVACPVGGVCVSGVGAPYAAPGYADLRGEPNAFLACPNPAACSGSGTCAPGYTNTAGSNLCLECADGYYKSDVDTCSACPEASLGLLLVVPVVFVVGVCVVVALGIRGWRKMEARKRGEGRAAGERRATPMYRALSMGILFVQTASLVERANFNWPSASRQVLSALSVVNANVALLAPSCSVTAGFYVEYKVFLVLPIAFTACAVAAAAVAGCVRTGSVGGGGAMAKRALRTVAVVGGPLAYLSLSFHTLKLFDCRPLGEGEWRIDGNKAHVCFDGEWMAALPFGLAGLGVYVVGIPAGLGATLFRARADLGSVAMKAMYGSLYTHLRQPYYLLESQYMLHRLLTIVCISFLDVYPVWQLIAILALFVAAAVGQWLYVPFVWHGHNRLQLMLSLATVGVAVCGALSMVGDKASTSASVATTGLVIATVAFGIAISAYTFGRELLFARFRTAAVRPRPAVHPPVGGGLHFFGARTVFGVDGVEVDTRGQREVIRIWAPDTDSYAAVLHAIGADADAADLPRRSRQDHDVEMTAVRRPADLSSDASELSDSCSSSRSTSRRGSDSGAW